MLFGVDVDNFITGIMAIVGLILSLEKAYKWIKEKFDYAHNKVNEENDIKETINHHIDEIKKLQSKYDILIEGIQNLLRDKLKKDALKYISKEFITQEELEEYEETYKIYTASGGNGVGTKYHDDVMNLPIRES